jgi:hypothetical protein
MPGGRVLSHGTARSHELLRDSLRFTADGLYEVYNEHNGEQAIVGGPHREESVGSI